MTFGRDIELRALDEFTARLIEGALTRELRRLDLLEVTRRHHVGGYSWALTKLARERVQAIRSDIRYRLRRTGPMSLSCLSSLALAVQRRAAGLPRVNRNDAAKGAPRPSEAFDFVRRRFLPEAAHGIAKAQP